jgi:Ca-activated chloride channel family protein
LTYPHAGLLAELPTSWRVKLQPLPDVLRLAVLICLVLALARPQMGFERERITQRGVDIMLALDVSGSMRAEDIMPNRIEAAKQTIRRFVSRLATDRVGLVVFAGRSFTQCPLTTDYAVLIDLLKSCRIGMVAFDGTAIGHALANCVYRFTPDQDGGEGAGPTADETKAAKPRSRVVVLLTDGYNNAGEIRPHDAAVMAKMKGIKVHCIGLGTVEGAPVPWVRGGRRTYLQNPDGTLLITRLDEATLRDIADVTGGRYFRATDAAALDRIYERIAAMEKHDIEMEHLTHHEERFVTVLLTALVLLLGELLLRATVLRVTR